MSEELLKKYPPKPRGARPPYGYVLDNDLLVPDLEIIAVLDKALDHLDAGLTLREVSDWFNTAKPSTAPHLSFIGLKGIWDRERPDHPRKKSRSKPVKLTAEQKAERKRRARAGAEKRSILFAQKRLQKIEAKPVPEAPHNPSIFVEPGTADFVPPEELEVPPAFIPNPGPQEEFLASSEKEVLYGGAAGGGKSYALLADPMRYFSNKNFNGLILRRTNDELRELIWKSHELYKALYPGKNGAQWSEKKSSWTFPSGARLWLTYLEQDKDVMRYQGQAFTYIGFDELTQHPTPFAWNYLRSRLRTTDPELKKSLFMRATTNPGGPGHGWVKKMFIDPSVPMEAFPARDLDTSEVLVFPKGHPKEGKPLMYRKFIPATVQDNKYLWEDGEYEKMLLTLPPDQQRQLLHGDWDVADGAAFSEFRRDIHTCKPFQIPRSWRRFRSCDYGYASWAAVHWYAIDPSDETLYVYRELYVTKHDAQMLARRILELEQDEDISYGVLDHQTFERKGSTGPSIAEEMIREGCRWRPTDNSTKARSNGKNRFHEVLRVNPVTEKPGIIFFENCRHIITTLPIIPTHPDGKDDIDDRFRDDHAYDSIRYGIMSRPKSYSIWDTPAYKRETYRAADPIYGY